jgi:hypothetical protein
VTGSPGAAVRFARLLQELAVDLPALDARASEISELLKNWDQPRDAPRTTAILAAVNIHGWYTALETAMERIARLLDETLPKGSAWHSELVSQMSVAVPGLRPAVVDSSLGVDLNEIRKFRHFFRNAYVLDFDPNLVKMHADRIARLQPILSNSLNALRSHVAAALETLARE